MFYAQLANDLDAIRIMWRNPSMHEAARQYSLSEAGAIFAGVRQLASHLATKISEPKKR